MILYNYYITLKLKIIKEKKTKYINKSENILSEYTKFSDKF